MIINGIDLAVLSVWQINKLLRDGRFSFSQVGEVAAFVNKNYPELSLCYITDGRDGMHKPQMLTVQRGELA